MTKPGKIFEAEISKTLRWIEEKDPEHVYWHRLNDTEQWQSKWHKNFAYLPRQPSDFILNAFGKTFYLEAKSSHNKPSYCLDWISEKQWEAAKRITNGGGNYVFLICDRSTRNQINVLCIPYCKELSIRCGQIKWKELEKYSIGKLLIFDEEMGWIELGQVLK